MAIPITKQTKTPHASRISLNTLSMLSEVCILLVTLCCVAGWVFLSKRRRTQPPLPPGPPGLPIVGNLPFIKPDLHAYFADLCEIYGPLVSLRLGSKTCIIVGSSSLAKEVLKDLDATFVNRVVTEIHRELTYGGVDIVCSSYGPEWRMLRKICTHEMLNSATLDLDAMYDLRRYEVNQTVSSILQKEGCVVPIGQQMYLTSFNLLTSMLWGGTLKGEDKVRVGAGFRTLMLEMADLGSSINISDFFPWLSGFNLFGVMRKVKDCAKNIDVVLEGVIDQHRKMNSVDRGKDFLHILLDLKDNNGFKMPLGMPQLKALLCDMVLGGTDTTSKTVEFAMAEIMNNPRIMRRAQEELQRVIGVGRQVEESHIHQLSYLRAIMKETLRLHPTGPLLFPHCPSQTCIVGGYTIPKGSTIFINVWAIQRSPSHWEDPVVFKPSRFLDNKYDFSGNNFAYFPFGSGRRMCPGIALAERMVVLFLESLLHYFDWNLPEDVDKLDLSEEFGISLKLRTTLSLIPSSR